jgi:hypothetical protein
VLSSIGERFKSLRTKSRARAWKQLQLDIMGHLAILQKAVSIPDLINRCQSIEDFLKGEKEGDQSDPMAYLRNFLNGGIGNGEQQTSKPN